MNPRRGETTFGGSNTSRARILVTSLFLGVLASLLPGAAHAAGGKYALLIGVGDFASRSTADNPGSAGDALDMQTLAVSRGFSPANVRVLIDEAATAAAIRSGLQWLASNCGIGTECIFSASGHVKQLSAADGDNEALDEHLWPYDGVFIPDGEIASYLRQLRGKAWINFSGCEAAGFNDRVSSPNRLFTASSQENQKSYESAAWKNSIWTGLLVDQGMLQGQADANGDGHATLQEAIDWARPRATEATLKQRKGRQTPVVAGGESTNWFPPGPTGAISNPAAAPATGRFCILFICL